MTLKLLTQPWQSVSVSPVKSASSTGMDNANRWRITTPLPKPRDTPLSQVETRTESPARKDGRTNRGNHIYDSKTRLVHQGGSTASLSPGGITEIYLNGRGDVEDKHVAPHDTLSLHSSKT